MRLCLFDKSSLYNPEKFNIHKDRSIPRLCLTVCNLDEIISRLFSDYSIMLIYSLLNI
jgi:hypothetical protein